MRRADVAAERAGFTLAEMLVVLLCVGILAALFFGALTVQLRLARVTAERTLENDALRTATVVLGGELRRASPEDVRAVAPDSIALRAFRGIAVVCAQTAQGLLVHYRGDRIPDPTKDSLLWLGAAGAEQIAAITSSTASAGFNCPAVASGTLMMWRTNPPIDQRGVLLLFESGGYFLSNRALRYRIGAAGRQPLTADLFDQHFTFFAQRSPHIIEYHVAPGGRLSAARAGAVHYPVRP